MTKELLHKFLNNQCTSEELTAVIDWIKTNGWSTDLEKWGLDELRNSEGEKQYRSKEYYNSMLNSIHHEIILEQLGPSEKRIGRKVSLLTWLTRVAALFMLPVIAYLLFTISQQNLEISTISNVQIDSLEIIAPIGSKTIVQLSDGSEVFLNHGSKLKYPQKFTGSTRNVVLTGEAYFKVEHNPEKPFIVETKELNITALGTEFNVLAYPNEDVIETTLVNGVVSLEQSSDGINHSLGKLKPSQHVKYNTNSGQIISTMGNVERYISWKEGKIIFKNEPIEQIAKRLNRWYNVEIVFENEIVKDYTYTATFVDETLFQILDLMELATPIKYKAMPRTKLAGGIYSKQKIIIGLK
uniref:FecR family protein n=1 Tax=uncultured Draconibacterium sp. TaxID=1573823 RepID=UPI0032169BBB